MQAEIYAFMVSAMRYVFVAAILYILFRIVEHSWSEYSELRRVKNWIENGYARHIEFLPPFDTEEDGFILAKRNLLGRSSRCDICIDDRSVRRRHAVIYEKRGKAFIRRKGRGKVRINGIYTKSRVSELSANDLVQLGEAEFYYRLKRMPMDGMEEQDEQG